MLVDELEFRWHSWDESQKLEFLTILKLWRTPAFFGVFLTSDPLIECCGMTDQDGQPRVFSLHELQDLA